MSEREGGDVKNEKRDYESITPRRKEDDPQTRIE